MNDSPHIRVLIVDDEPLAREMLREMLHADPQIAIVGEAGNGREAIEAIRNLTPDLIFLDVQMPALGGFEVLEALGTGSIPHVIFVTAFDQYAVRAFEVHALDYLLKPFDQERFDLSWQRAKAQIMRERNGGMDQRILALLEELKAGSRYLERLVIKSGGRIYFLETNEIDWIEAEGNYVSVH
ncbi:MAG: LytR/AlgR family response regulator transcription factor, partial [Pyrinomonadaceae bacterium]